MAHLHAKQAAIDACIPGTLKQHHLKSVRRDSDHETVAQDLFFPAAKATFLYSSYRAVITSMSKQVYQMLKPLRFVREVKRARKDSLSAQLRDSKIKPLKPSKGSKIFPGPLRGFRLN